MAPTPFTAVLVFRPMNEGGTTQIHMSCSDEVGKAYIAPDGHEGFFLPGDQEMTYVLQDIILSRKGTDTTKGEIFVNNKSIGEYIINDLNLPDTVLRQFASAPLYFAGGSFIKIIMRA